MILMHTPSCPGSDVVDIDDGRACVACDAFAPWDTSLTYIAPRRTLRPGVVGAIALAVGLKLGLVVGVAGAPAFREAPACPGALSVANGGVGAPAAQDDSLLAVPEPLVMEYAGGRLYWTNERGVRRLVSFDPAPSPARTTLAAGTGSTGVYSVGTGSLLWEAR